MENHTEFYAAKQDLPDYLIGDDYEGIYIDIKYSHIDNVDKINVCQVSYIDVDENIKCRIKTKETKVLLQTLENLLCEFRYTPLILKELASDNPILKLI